MNEQTKHRVSNHVVEFLKGLDNADVKKEFEDKMESFKNKRIPNGTSVTCVYFDEDDDEYKTFTAFNGKVARNDFFSWDELSQYLYELS